MGDKTKKVHTKRASEDTPNPYVFEQSYFPSALIGRALGLHPKDPEINRKAKKDKPEGVGRVARPVMLRPEPDLPLLVRFLVIPAERIESTARRFLVEPHRREHPPRGFNALLGRTLALIRHHFHVVTDRA